MKNFTPEVIEALVKNADALRSVLTSGDEATLLKDGAGCFGGAREDCCSPKLVKFKFILCEDIEIKNINAAAEDNFKPLA